MMTKKIREERSVNMSERYGEWKGTQGKCWRLWKTDRGFEVEQVWGPGARGVEYITDSVRDAKRYLSKVCLAKRVMRGA